MPGDEQHPVYVEISRVWPMAKKYETYRVTIRVPVTETGERAVLTAARYAAKQAHLAWGEYKAEWESLGRPGGDFRSAGDALREEEKMKMHEAQAARAEQGPAKPDSPRPTAPGAGKGAGAEEPDGDPVAAPEMKPPAALDETSHPGDDGGGITQAQLLKIRDITERSYDKKRRVEAWLTHLERSKLEDLTKDEGWRLLRTIDA